MTAKLKTHLYKMYEGERPYYISVKEWYHQTAYCGFIRKDVTVYAALVTCKLCLREMGK